MFLGAISFIFAISILVIVHEFGHLIFAKAFGMEVKEFSIGFGKPALSVTIGGTKYSIRPILFGGYVNIAEMEMDAEAWREGKGFMQRPLYQRIAVLFAGSLMNFILAIVIFGCLGIFIGKTIGVTNKIERILPNSPAAIAGLREGDEIIAVGKLESNKVEKLREEIEKYPGNPVVIKVRRNGQILSFIVVPKAEQTYRRVKGGKIEKVVVGRIGILFQSITQKMSFGEAVWTGLRDTYYLTRLVIAYPYLAATKKVPVEVGGPLAVAKITGEGAQLGFSVLMERIAMISVNLAVFNLFPIPGLDGGILFIMIINSVYALIFRRNIDYRKIVLANTIGIALLLGLLAILTIFDIRRFFQ
ncbi:site-2 protease family protein [bacterium]|nr:site-2 protease family protein [bacterium]